ncbi:MAG TPA: hypothetical protein VE466_14725 [Acidimicrobiales bacterium]|nr:hypothetical protein [Acidimicrobiales bacterium]
MFPPHIRSHEDALDYLATWCDIIGGELLDGIDWDEIEDQQGRLIAVRVRPFRIGFVVGTVLTPSVGVDAGLAADFYSFDLRLADGTLIWRHDCHAGHEYLGTGRYHLHVGPTENNRVTDRPQTLQTIFELVTNENLRRSWDLPGS